MVPGEWPPIEEVGEECIVKDVGHYWRRENKEVKLICYVCHEENHGPPKKRPRITRVSDDDNRQSSARRNEWKRRDETSDRPKGYYVTKQWYSKNPKCWRCRDCNRYLRPREMK